MTLANLAISDLMNWPNVSGVLLLVLVALLASGAGVGGVLVLVVWLIAAEFSGLQVSPNLSCWVWVLPE